MHLAQRLAGLSLKTPAVALGCSDLVVRFNDARVLLAVAS